MHSVIRQCIDEYNTSIQEGDITPNVECYYEKIAHKFNGYPVNVNVDGIELKGILIFVFFDAIEKTSLPLHKVLEQESLDLIEKKLKINQSLLLSEIIVGEHEINIENDINKIEDYNYYYNCLKKDGVIDESYEKQKHLEHSLEELEKDKTFWGRYRKLTAMGVPKLTSLQIILTDNEKD